MKITLIHSSSIIIILAHFCQSACWLLGALTYIHVFEAGTQCFYRIFYSLTTEVHNFTQNRRWPKNLARLLDKAQIYTVCTAWELSSWKLSLSIMILFFHFRSTYLHLWYETDNLCRGIITPYKYLAYSKTCFLINISYEQIFNNIHHIT